MPVAVRGHDDRGVGIDGADRQGGGALDGQIGIGRRRLLHRLVHEVVAVDAAVALEAPGDAPPDADEVLGVAPLVEDAVLLGGGARAGRGVEVDDDPHAVLPGPRQDALLEDVERPVEVGVVVVVALPAAGLLPVLGDLVAREVGAPFLQRREIVLGDLLEVDGEHDAAGGAGVADRGRIRDAEVPVDGRLDLSDILGAQGREVELDASRALLDAEVERGGRDPGRGNLAREGDLLLAPVADAVRGAGPVPAAVRVVDPQHELEAAVGDPGLGDADALGADAEAQAVKLAPPEERRIEHGRGARLLALLAGRERSEDPVPLAADALRQIPLEIPEADRLRAGKRRGAEKRLDVGRGRFGLGGRCGGDGGTGRERRAEEDACRFHVVR